MESIQLKPSLKRYILLLTLLPSLLITALLTSYFVATQQSDAEENLIRQVGSTIKYLSKSSELALFAGDKNELYRLTWTVESDKEIKSIIFFNIKKKQLLNSGKLVSNAEVIQKDGFFIRDLGKKWLFQTPVSYSQEEVADYPLLEGEREPIKNLGWVQIIADKSRLIKKQKSILFKGASIGIVVFLLLALLAHRFSRSITRPLEKITQTISEFEAGNLSARVDVDAKGELDTLAKGINRLAEKVKISNDSLQKRVNRAVIKLTQTLEELEDKNDKLRKTGMELIEANKAKDDFLASMSHELRTPLTAIMGYSSLLEKSNLTEKQEEYSKIVQHASTMLLSLIDNILDFSKLKSHLIELEYLPFNLESLLEDVLDLHLPEAQSKGVKLIFKVDLDVPYELLGDELRIKQIINNLVRNAIKFTSKGSVQVNVALVGAGNENNHHFGLLFSVIDTGIGFKLSDPESLFDPFVQADSSISRRFGGSGLGLMICKKLVDLFAGEIRIKSKEGKGTQVTFSLLKLEKQEGKIKIGSLIEDNSEKKLSLLKGLTVLIAEDNVYVKELLEMILTSEGITAISVDSGEEALKKCQETVIDLVLLDYNMPGLNGYETCKRIRQSFSPEKLPVFLITADILNVRKLNLEVAGVNEIIYKPVDEQKLLQSIMRYCSVDDQNSERPLARKKVMDYLPEELIFKELKRLFVLLQQAVNENHREQIKKYAHQICGVAGPSTIHGEIENLARKIENNLMEENYDQINDVLAELKIQMLKNVKKGGGEYE